MLKRVKTLERAKNVETFRGMLIALKRYANVISVFDGYFRFHVSPGFPTIPVIRSFTNRFVPVGRYQR